MIEEHRKTLTKQIEGWITKELVTVEAQNSLLKHVLIGLVAEAQLKKNINTEPQVLVEQFMNDPHKSALQELKRNYSNACLHWKQAKDEDARFLTVNIKFNIQAVIFRILTTLAIGFSIMLVYWTAHCLGVPMPLLRIPT